MKKLVAICLILTMCLGMGYALAKTVEFTFFLTSKGEVDVGYPAEKSDSEQRFYVTETYVLGSSLGLAYAILMADV